MKESSSIELNVSLLKSCSAERQLFCTGVQPGSARVFRCLAENMNDADFGSTCRYQIIQKLQRRCAHCFTVEMLERVSHLTLLLVEPCFIRPIPMAGSSKRTLHASYSYWSSCCFIQPSTRAQT